ncbi:hypothetical protein [Sedimentisphaera salicampi]|uniref:Uncharacterized protein n=1 Tax=Sedimentisphaera salicampi TaxID=1941349 RepID=A0A1W6LP99_9BACT|nr:hypothetical protein [Sedimentisphaera salicampi]ARN57609.1 hypothetical protein STSP1_02026 [Sedimentisphaera salicampi]
MSRSKESPIERIVHWIVLGVSALFSLAVLLYFVIMGPNTLKYGSQEVSPANVDREILQDTQTIENKLESSPQPKTQYSAKLDDFKSMMDSSLGGLDLQPIGVPATDLDAIQGDREYALPDIPRLANLEAQKVRTVGFMPLSKLEPANDYSQAEVEPRDIDVVTLQAEFDISELLASFKRTFAGRGIKAEWRDQTLASPVFAGIEMQRQVLTATGWSDWQTVERPKVDKYSELIQQAYDVQKANQLNVLMPQFKTSDVWRNALQPQMYDIAVVDEKWYPPSLYDEYEKLMEMQRREELRELRESRRQESEERDTRRRRPQRDTQDIGGGGFDPFGGGGGGGAGFNPGMNQPDTNRDRRTRRRDERQEEETPQRPQVDLEEEYQKLLIEEGQELEELSGVINVWSHDDTVSPGQTYRYRMRCGVFNPVAGKDWLKEDYSEYNDDVVLWSEFTEPTKSFEILKTQYIFPSDGKTNGVLCKVAKLELGQWHLHDFFVKPGESVGGLAEEKQDDRRRRPDQRQDEEEEETEPEEFDYSTGAVYVDTVDTSTWSLLGNFVEKQYESMVYIQDQEVNVVPIRNRNWSSSMTKAYKTITAEAEREVTVKESRSGGFNRGGQQGGQGQGGFDPFGGGGFDPFGGGGGR